MSAAAFAAANLRAWADYVEATGEGVHVKDYAISVDTPLNRHIGMAPLASSGSVGWRHAPKLKHRNRRFGDHGSLWSDHHKHGEHPPLPDLDEPPPEPPCPRCTLAMFICRCDEDDLRNAIRERDTRIKTLTAERDEARGHLRAEMDEALAVRRASGATGQERTALVVEQTVRWATTLEARCYAVDEPAVFPSVDDDPGFCTCSFWPTTNMACPDVNEAKFDLAIKKVFAGDVNASANCIDDTTASHTTRRCVVDLFDELTDAADRGEPCPRCDSPTGPYTGFGLAGGGFGSYAGCYACDVFIKIRIPDDAQEDTQDGAE